MSKDACKKTEKLSRNLNFQKHCNDNYRAYIHRVNRLLWTNELRLYRSNYVISNQSQEIKTLKDKVNALENATALQLARKLKRLITKLMLRDPDDKDKIELSPDYNFETNYTTMLLKADQINQDPKSNSLERLWVRQLPKNSVVNQYKEKLLQEDDTPKISIILPVFNIEGKWLNKAIQSVLEQLYQNWELCIVDDASENSNTLNTLRHFATIDQRIKVQYQKQNRGISETSNRALSMATGQYVTFLDHDDYLSPNALLEVYQVISTEEADFIYSDEAIVNPLNKMINVFFKPDYSPDLLLSMNYINHLMVIRKELIDQCGGFRNGIEGAQDYDLVLKITENANKKYHIHKILYFWRLSTGTFSATDANKKEIHNAGRYAIESALKRKGVKADVHSAKRTYNYYVKRKITQKPKVSIIIPFKDKYELLEKCLESVLFNTNYNNYEIIGINNESNRSETIDGMSCFEKMDKRITFYPYQGTFNYSKINNFGVSKASGEHIVLMNSDIEVINNEWLEALLEQSQRKQVGAVGAKLYYPDDTIQHAGVIIGISGIAGHSYRHEGREADGVMNRLTVIQNVSAVTGALMMVKKRLFIDIGGLDEINLQVALNDVDFCLKLCEKGYYNVFTPYCEAYHHESITRGYDTTLAQKQKFDQESKYFSQKWAKYLKADPYYNKNLTLEREDFKLKKAAELITRVRPIY